MRKPSLALAALAAGVLALLVLASPGAAEPPDNTTWSPLTLEGAPVDAGFLDAGFLVYGTTDAGSVAGSQGVDCSVGTGGPTEGTEDADLFLVSFPGEPGCEQALDTSGLVEGVQSLATASQADRAVVAVPADGSGDLAGDNIQAYRLEGANLTQAWSTTVNGQPLHVATDPGSRHPAATFLTGDSNHRLAVFTATGNTDTNVALPGLPRALDVSDNGRYVAVGGNVTESGSSLGWVHLYDLSSSDDDPEIDRTIPRPRAGIVTSVSVTDSGTLYGGLLDGTVRLFKTGGNDDEVSLGTDPAHLGATADGDTVFVASGNETARLDRAEGDLTIRWRSLVNGSSQVAIARPPHLFAAAETVNGFGTGGERIWETTGGDVVAANATGLGLAVATETTSGSQSARTSSLRGLVLERNVTIEQDEPLTVTPGGVARANRTVTNLGSAIVNLTPSAEDGGLSLATTPTSFHVLPSHPRNASFTVHATSDASPGPRTLSVDPGPESGLSEDLALDVRVTSQPNITVTPAKGQVGDQDVTQGQTVTVRLALQNHGNAEAVVDLEVLQTVDPAWNVEFSPGPTVSVPGGSVATTRLDIHVPAGAENGTRNQIIVRGISDQGASSLVFDLTVNPFEVIRIRPATITQQMAPGETKPYDLSVENLGSVEAVVQLDLQPIGPDGEPCLPTEWGVVLESSEVTVPAAGSQPIRAQITGPSQIPVPGVENGTAPCTADAQRPSLRAELTGTSTRGSKAGSLLFANVDPSLERPNETPKREPFPAAGVLAAVLAGAALLTRREHP